MLFVLAVHALLLFMLLTIAAPPEFIRMRSSPLTIDLLPADAGAAERAPKVEREKRPAGGGAPKKAPAEVKPPPLMPVPKTPPMPDLGLLRLTNEELASVKSTMGTSRRGRGSGQGKDGEHPGAGAMAEAAAGGGSGGERLFDADWYRKPTRAELATYLPATARQTGWGMIACQTVEDYRVENCRELGQAPAGSGFSRAVRQAAWQFRVLPPRLGGRPLIGAWVRIRIDYIDGIAKQ